MNAGFASREITPQKLPIQTYMSTADSVRDPLRAQAAVFSDKGNTAAFVALDTVIVEAEYAVRIRKAVEAQIGIPASHVQVHATHTHACPSVVDRSWMQKDMDYIEYMIAQAVDAVCAAYANCEPVEIGVGSGFEARVSFNRRYKKRDGSFISQPTITPTTQDILARESEIDTEVGVLAARRKDGSIAGVLVNFACHACHHLGDLSAGFPGILRDRLEAEHGAGCVAVFLNGPCGNIMYLDFSNPFMTDEAQSKEYMGKILADDVSAILEKNMTWSVDGGVSIVERVVPVAYRPLDFLREHVDRMEEYSEEYNVYPGLVRLGWYEYSLKELEKLHAQSDHEDAILQVIQIGDAVFASVPCEYFSEYALRIKTESPVRRTFVVSLANGWLGYIPTLEAFAHLSGHETVQSISSRMVPEAGNQMASALLEMIRLLPSSEAK